MQLRLKSLALWNFKGIRDLKLTDLGNEVNISGRNESGKTTIMDAFTFCLFGKDSEDTKDFSIKTLDSNNEPMHRAEHSVTAVLSVDGMDSKFKRIYKEKWVKKRGEENEEFSGHETTYFVNEVPLSQREYQEKVENIIPENLFKQITNPAYFNSMKWDARRAMLFKMAGDVQDNDVIAVHQEFADFLNILSGKTFEEYKRELAAKRKLLKDSISGIPVRIEEVNRLILPEPDNDAISADMAKYNTRISEIDTLASSAAKKFDKKNTDNQAKQNQIFEIKRQISRLEFEDKSKAQSGNDDVILAKNKLSDTVRRIKEEIQVQEESVKFKTARKLSIETENTGLRNQWAELNAKVIVFDPADTLCPVCKRGYDPDIIETKQAEMTANFNTDKASKLQVITNKGQSNTVELKRIEKELTDLSDKITGLRESYTSKSAELNAVVIPETPAIVTNPQIKVLQEDVKTLEASIEPLTKTDNTALTTEKNGIIIILEGLKKQLMVKENNDKHKERITELSTQLKSLSQQLASLEKQEFQCDNFTRAKIGMVEDKINAMFDYVKFKMFNLQINGGLDEVCETLINGVPYSDANRAARINAGISIINTLCKHYDIYAPCIIDNAEAANTLIPTKGQMIKLYVTTDKELKIVNL
jgi:exonuclease SbcC